MKKISFTMASSTIKYLVISLTTKVKDLYNKKYKMMMKEIEEDTIEIYRVYVLEEFVLWKYQYQPNPLIDLILSLSKFQRHFHRNRMKAILQFVWNYKRL